MEPEGPSWPDPASFPPALHPRAVPAALSGLGLLPADTHEASASTGPADRAPEATLTPEYDACPIEIRLPKRPLRARRPALPCRTPAQRSRPRSWATSALGAAPRARAISSGSTRTCARLPPRPPDRRTSSRPRCPAPPRRRYPHPRYSPPSTRRAGSSISPTSTRAGPGMRRSSPMRRARLRLRCRGSSRPRTRTPSPPRAERAAGSSSGSSRLRRSRCARRS